MAKGESLWFTVVEAATLLGIGERAVRVRAQRGRLEARWEKEAGRRRLLVRSEELAARASGVRTGGADFAPRFHRRVPGELALQPEEFAALAEGAEAILAVPSREELALRDLRAGRDRLMGDLARVQSAAAREQDEAGRQEGRLHRYIERQARLRGQRERRLHLQVATLARALGQAEHELLKGRSRRPWWRRLLAVLTRPLVLARFRARLRR